ncbi:Uncharacterised protein [Chlamydia trachomatis]|nr:Uncharacterised protein [Chlamydia trachomatis]
MSLEKIYTAQEVAEMERVSPHSVTNACVAGEYPGAYRLSVRGPWRVPESAIVERRRRLADQARADAKRLEAESLRLEDYRGYSAQIAPLMPGSRRRRKLGA